MPAFASTTVYRQHPFPSIGNWGFYRQFPDGNQDERATKKRAPPRSVCPVAVGTSRLPRGLPTRPIAAARHSPRTRRLPVSTIPLYFRVRLTHCTRVTWRWRSLPPNVTGDQSGLNSASRTSTSQLWTLPRLPTEPARFTILMG